MMLHAIFGGDDERRALKSVEAPYAISRECFQRYLELLKARRVNILSPTKPEPRTGNNCLVTFDDGHASNFLHAAPLLEAAGARGLFFITPELIRNEDSFCNWAQLRSMSEAGHSIQSHGFSHRFLSDLTDQQCLAELRDSRQKIEDATGSAVTELSFPGGRYGPREVTLGLEAGYERFYTSDFGIHRIHANDPLPRVMRRLVFRSNTSAQTAAALSRGETLTMLRYRGTATGKALVRKTLGSKLYYALYKRLR